LQALSLERSRASMVGLGSNEINIGLGQIGNT